MHLYIYPHCHINSTETEILVYDGEADSSVYLTDFYLSGSEQKSLRNGFLEIDTQAKKEFAELCVKGNLGYCLCVGETYPFISDRNVSVGQSLYKERNCLGYNLASSTNLLLRRVIVFLNNDDLGLNESDCLQMEYPYNNDIPIKIGHILNQLTLFQNLEEITLAGEFKAEILALVASYAQQRGIIIRYRMLYRPNHETILPWILDEYNGLQIELFIRPDDINESLRNIASDRIILKGIVKTVDDIKCLSDIRSMNYLPVLSSNSNEIIRQMLVSKNEVLHSQKLSKSCNLSSAINIGVYGSLVINSDGRVTCLGQVIGSLFKNDLSSILNHWVGEKDCAWYYTRRKRERCRNCALQCLCPPVSMYEMLGFYMCPCSLL